MFFLRKEILKTKLALIIIVIFILIAFVSLLMIFRELQDRGPSWVIGPYGKYSWQALGPGGGGHFDVFAFSPDYVFVGTTTAGVLRSPDHGKTWFPALRGLYDRPINDIAVDPINPTILYVATHGGVYKSENSGDDWHLLRNGFPPTEQSSYSAPILSIAIDPSNTNVVYAGIGFSYKTGATQGSGDVYKSLDGGQNWVPCNIGDDSAAIYDLAVDLRNGNIIYAATDKGFFRTLDAEQNWVRIDDLDSRGLAVGYDEANTVTVLYRAVWDSGIYKSDDGGETWTKLTNLNVSADFLYRRIAMHPANPNVVYVGDYGNLERGGRGIYGTTDGGTTWFELDKFGDSGWRRRPSPIARGLGLNPYDPEELFLGTAMMVYRTYGDKGWKQVFTTRVSRGGGANTKWPGRWRARGSSNNTVVGTKPVFHPTRYDEYMIGYLDIYIWRTTNDGKSWENIMVPQDNDIRALAADSNDASHQTWFAANSPQACCDGSLYKTTDGGQNWSKVTGLPSNRIWSIAVVPGNSNKVYVGTQNYGVYWSTDGGASFSPRNGSGQRSLPSLERQDRIYHMAIDSNDPNILYVPVIASKAGGIYKTTDGGEYWDRLEGIDISCGAVEISKVDHKTVFAGCSNRVFKSDDGGNSWVQIYSRKRWKEYVIDIASHPTNPDVLCFVAKDDPYHDQAFGTGLFCTTDSGNTWENLAEILGLRLASSRVAFHPLPNPQTGEHDLFYMTGGGGVYRIRGITGSQEVVRQAGNRTP